MMQELLDQILLQTYTQTEALNRLRALKDLVLFELFGPNYQKEVGLPKLPSTQQTTWLSSLDPNLFKKFTKESVYKDFDEMEKTIKEIQPLVIFMPFEISNEGINKLGEHLRKVFGKNFLAEIKIDQALIAGTALVWNGIYKDYSVRQKIAENRLQILEMMKGYLKK